MKYKVALFIGRFQPLHKGHIYSLTKALGVGERVVIGIGSSNLHDEKNPWSYGERRKMWEVVGKERGWREKVAAIWELPDVFDDTKWGAMIEDKLQELIVPVAEVVGVGNNEWTNRVLRERGMAVVESGLYKRGELEGIRIRELMAKGDPSWRERVPREIVELIRTRKEK